MTRHRSAMLLAAIVVLPLLACRDEAAMAPPMPQEPTTATVAHFCDMAVLDHGGPKGQIFLKGSTAPIWFSSVRDTVAYTMLPEEPKAIAAIYVNDMAEAKDWHRPEPGTWVEARSAWYVLGSDYGAGMGGKEAVPFSDPAAARDFAAHHGGTLHRFAEIPESFVLDAEAEAPPAAVSAQSARHP